ncbi:hypothetical protein Dsin_020493 [Dipteronia sinensis]|uniref:Uncharacterized protein n=1 Tax=Dipteronia sinensis TaxID=43782 RepID=A0AAE0A9B9_9ROSI|nr:hypothetical protein Dsin_020493 [Dipteronia sinensis]
MVLGVDFNTVMNPNERIGVSCNSGSMRSFNSFMLQGNVVDIPLQGIKYTWSNNRDREAWARLDRFLLSPIILLRFSNLVQKGLPRCLSDHNPILIGDLGKANLKRWIKARKLTITMPLEIEMKLEEIVSKAVIDGWTDSLRQNMLDLVDKLCKSFRREDQTWRQKSRINWLKEGDKNTKFFDSVANGRRRRNLIDEMYFEGVKVAD